MKNNNNVCLCVYVEEWRVNKSSCKLVKTYNTNWQEIEWRSGNTKYYLFKFVCNDWSSVFFFFFRQKKFALLLFIVDFFTLHNKRFSIYLKFFVESVLKCAEGEFNSIGIWEILSREQFSRLSFLPREKSFLCFFSSIFFSLYMEIWRIFGKLSTFYWVLNQELRTPSSQFHFLRNSVK